MPQEICVQSFFANELAHTVEVLQTSVVLTNMVTVFLHVEVVVVGGEDLGTDFSERLRSEGIR